MVRFLISNGADVNADNGEILINVLRKRLKNNSKYIKIIKLLLDNGAYIILKNYKFLKLVKDLFNTNNPHLDSHLFD